MKFKSIPNSEMKSIKAGSNKWWDKAQDTFWTLEGKGAGSLWGMLGGSAFTHTDQIGKGFKEGSKEDVLGKITPKS